MVHPLEPVGFYVKKTYNFSRHLNAMVIQWAAAALRQQLLRGRVGDASSKLPADLVVLGTHGRIGLGRLVLGSVAETVMHQSACSVLVIRLKQ